MHACGHDTHVAILLATATRADADEGSAARHREVHLPAGGRRRAAARSGRPARELMVKEGVLENPKVDAIFGLHVFANVPDRHNHLSQRSVHGGRRLVRDHRQRQADARLGAVARRRSDRRRRADRHRAADDRQPQRRHHASCRRSSPSGSSSPASATTSFPTPPGWSARSARSTTRCRADIHARVKRIAEADRDRAPARRWRSDRPRVPGDRQRSGAHRAGCCRRSSASRPGKVKESELITGAEDFTFFQRAGAGPVLLPRHHAARSRWARRRQNHSPLFFVDETALLTGVRALTHLAVDYMQSSGYSLIHEGGMKSQRERKKRSPGSLAVSKSYRQFVLDQFEELGEVTPRGHVRWRRSLLA